MFRKGARAEGHDAAFVHSLQQVQRLTSEAPPPIPPHQCLCSLRLSFVTVLKSCQCEPAGQRHVLSAQTPVGGVSEKRYVALHCDPTLPCAHHATNWARLKTIQAVGNDVLLEASACMQDADTVGNTVRCGQQTCCMCMVESQKWGHVLCLKDRRCEQQANATPSTTSRKLLP